MKKSALRAATILLLLSAVACGGDTSTGPDIPQPSRASIRVTLVGTPLLSFGNARNYALSYSIRVAESGGVGANMNFIRLDARVGSAVVERQDIGAQSIIAQSGTNRIEANATRDFNITQEFNEGRTDNVLLTVSFTDDRGNSSNHEVIVTF